MGLLGVDTKKYVEDKAVIGNLGHLFVTDYLQGKTTDIDDYSKNQIQEARNSAASWFAWARGKKIEPILIEHPLVSEECQFGGTMDIYARVDGTLELIDLKTGGGIYDEFLIQVTAYRRLLLENGYPVQRCRILNIPRTKDEAFAEETIGKRTEVIAWKIFLNCRENYELHKRLTA